ncbi:MAG: hypothetical protein E7348_03810 [Clostridiales bacterium]|nr:hypothetical protein [Clostridiales bacterium]
MGLFSWLFKKQKHRPIKLGLALGSGGAKGFAHLGALKAFEENGITFDMVAGTSIGSIVGAFYCSGYSTTDILELLKRIDVKEVKNFFMIKMSTSKIFDVIDKHIGELNIEQLKKPFKAVATNLETGKEHIFDRGSVALALCASSSIPPFFKPVTIDGVKYIDGAFTNSIPADVVRGMGADYVVGIDLATTQTKPSIIKKVFPSYKSEIEKPWEKGYEFSDTMIHPDLNGYTSVQFWNGDKMYEIGYQQAISQMDKIKSDLKKLKYKL